jgi:hypothetical protein
VYQLALLHRPHIGTNLRVRLKDFYVPHEIMTRAPYHNTKQTSPPSTLETAVGGTTGAAAGLVQRLPLISGAEYETDSLQSLNDHPRWDDGTPAGVA